MWIIKIGGGGRINLPGIVAGLARRREPLIIVHGANALRDELAAALNKPRKTITSAAGVDSVYSDEEALDIMMMAYSGLRNKRIVELCQRHGLNAVGLSGLDGGVVRGRRNGGFRCRDGAKLKVVRDLSGKPERINGGLLQLLLQNGYTPVLTMPILDETNSAVNSENDDVVALLQKTLQADCVLQFIEAPGFLREAGDDSSLVRQMSATDIPFWIDMTDGRIKRKMMALQKLFVHGARCVRIGDGRGADPVGDLLSGQGTVVQ